MDLSFERQRERWLRILRYAQMIATSGKRKSATTKVFCLLRKHFQLKASRIKWSLPKAGKRSRGGEAKKILSAMRAKIPPWQWEYRRFMKRRMRIYDGRQVTLGDARTNCRKVVKEGSFKEISSLDEETGGRLIFGEDIVVDEANWNFPFLSTRRGSQKMWEKTTEDWEEKTNDDEMSAAVRETTQEVLEEEKPEIPSASYVERVRLVKTQRKDPEEEPRLDDEVIAPVDGDCHRRTIRTRAGLILSLLVFLRAHADYYRLHPNVSPEALGAQLGRAAVAAFPTRLLFGWRGTWRADQVSYWYAFIKSACFPNGRWTCTKDHSCWREIQASCMMPRPVANVICWVAKAFRVLLKRWRSATARLVNLSKLAVEVKKGAKKLKRHPRFRSRCVKCGCEKSSLTGIKGDARSYYKRVKVRRVIAAMKYCFKKARDEATFDTIILLRKARWRASIGGSAEARVRDRIVLRFEEMERVLRFVLQEGGYAVCCGLVIQAVFPTMGSALSEIVSALVAVHCGILLEEHREEFIADGFLTPECESGWEFIHGLGHVDDLLLQSTCLCAKCLHLAQQKFTPETRLAERGPNSKERSVFFKVL